MKKLRLSLATGIACILLGAVWTYFTIVGPVVRAFVEPGFWPFLLLLLLPPISVPGPLAIYNGYKLIQHVSKQSIRRAVGFGSFFACLFSVSAIAEWLPEDVYEQGIGLFFLGTTILAILLYVWLSKILMARAGLLPEKGEFVGKGILTILTIELWVALSSLVDFYAPTKEGYQHIKESPWELLGTFGSILFAWICYKLAVKLILRDDSKSNALTTT